MSSALLTAFLVVALVVYAVASLLLFVFGLNLTGFAVAAWRRGRAATTGTNAGADTGPSGTPPANETSSWPAVTVQLPIYNEASVARRVVEATCRLDYPTDRLQIQVLDDSDDDTSDIVATAVAEAQARGIDIEHRRRRDRLGYKAGALADGLTVARGSLVAVFDADFLPPSDFLRTAVPHFAEQPTLAFVQARWGHLNRGYSWLTRLQAPAIDSHFLVEQQARGIRGHWFNFNGTAGIWRVEAIDDAGGWQHDTLTEDLDLSYRAHLRGWRGQYLPDLVVPGELPAEVAAFRAQQHRWARGSLECGLKLLRPVWRARTSPTIRFQATAHLLAYTIHLLLLLLVLTYPIVIIASERLGVRPLLNGLGYVLAPASLAPGLFLITGNALSVRRDGRGLTRRTGGVRRLGSILLLIIYGSGMMVNTARAAVQIVTKPNPVFERTAKHGLVTSGETLGRRRDRYGFDRSTRQPIDRIVLVEFLLGLYALATAGLAASVGNWGIFGFVLLFGCGIITVASTTVVESVGLRRRHRRPRRPSQPRQPGGGPVDRSDSLLNPRVSQ